ncbi:S-adenosyl-L-methionine-dependent methyltransferase [Hesseltinella vesiculosa]|uniref:S-adenosyl-L-methionine-dependent methyltransferase n=1 Tax=Hesseltinella vesiculosa TaxID=101127 RepID=A0A1X2GCE5_9FUNG|nr:S-adenosyl-L-methionine-dependent methyltransferase [Hesseltinella vesiculosa]
MDPSPNAPISFACKDGRTIVADQEVSYILPSDGAEVTRLDLNHQLWLQVTRLYKVPMHDALTRGVRVLDVGCGPGFWTRDMARLYPKSSFVAIDMADVFVHGEIPSNVQFQLVNAAKGLPFKDDSFDFVFQRFLVMGFPTDQYIQSVKEMKRVLKPGGYLETMELVNDCQLPSPALSQVAKWIDDALVARGMDSFIADKVAQFLKDEGFVGIEEQDYSVPIGPWGGPVGDLYLAIQKLAMPAAGVMVTELTPVTENQYRQMVKKALDEVLHYQCATRFRLVYAREPVQ